MTDVSGFYNGQAPSAEELAAIKRARQARASGKTKPNHSAQERPSLEEVRKRYRRDTYDRLLRPHYLPIYHILYPDEDERSGWDPGGCSGPWGRRRARGKLWQCQKHHFCCFCWECRCRWSSLHVMLAHYKQPNAVKLSMSLPGIRQDPEAMLAARRKISEALRYRGFTRQTLWIQTFGENPMHGAKGHLDGVLSGPDADMDVLDVRHNDALRRVLKPFHERPDGGFWNPFISFKLVDVSTPTKQLRDLYNKGRYAGRPTFHVRRIHAGLYGDAAGLRVRYTNVHDKTKLPEVQDIPASTKSSDWSHRQLVWAAQLAEAWRLAGCGKPVLPRNLALPARELDAILHATRWRSKFRLESDDRMRQRFQQ